jgi:hypothetical protein
VALLANDQDVECGVVGTLEEVRSEILGLEVIRPLRGFQLHPRTWNGDIREGHAHGLRGRVDDIAPALEVPAPGRRCRAASTAPRAYSSQEASRVCVPAS